MSIGIKLVAKAVVVSVVAAAAAAAAAVVVVAAVAAAFIASWASLTVFTDCLGNCIN